MRTRLSRLCRPVGIHEGDFAHSDDADAGFVAHAVHDVVELVGDAEEEGAVDFIDFDARREVQLLLVVMDFAFVGEVDLIARYGDLRRLGDTFHGRGTWLSRGQSRWQSSSRR